METNINNYTFVEVEEKICEFCGSIDSYDKTNTCRNCGANQYRINKVRVKTFKPTPKPIIKSDPVPKTNSESEHDAIVTKKIIAGAIGVIIMTLFIFIPILIFASVTSGHEGEYSVTMPNCPHCGSHDTDGYYTFWYNSGLLCTGSYEYEIANADYTIISCNNCGYSFKHYL